MQKAESHTDLTDITGSANEKEIGSISSGTTAKNNYPICAPRRKKKQKAQIEREHSLTFSVEEYNMYKDHTYVNVPVTDDSCTSGNGQVDNADTETGEPSRALSLPLEHQQTLAYRPPRRSRAGKPSRRDKSPLSPASRCSASSAGQKTVNGEKDNTKTNFSENRSSLGRSFIPLVMRGTMEKVGRSGTKVVTSVARCVFIAPVTVLPDVSTGHSSKNSS